MSRNRVLLSVLFLLVSLSLSVRAQESVKSSQSTGEPQASGAKTTPADKQKALIEDRQKAFDVEQALWLVNDISNASTEIKDDQTRIQVQARLADALWDYNQDRARRLFETAFDSIDLVKFDSKTAGPDGRGLLFTTEERHQWRLSSRRPEASTQIPVRV